MPLLSNTVGIEKELLKISECGVVQGLRSHRREMKRVLSCGSRGTQLVFRSSDIGNEMRKLKK
jgi:hypothetical protein